MNSYELAGEVPVQAVIEGTNARDAVTRYILTYNYLPERVGNRGVIGQCAKTQAVILEGDEFEGDQDDLEAELTLTKAVDDLGEDATNTFEDVPGDEIETITAAPVPPVAPGTATGGTIQ